MSSRPTKRYRSLIAAAGFLAVLSVSAPGNAAERHGDGHRHGESHRHGEAHEHGVSKMKLAIDGNGLEIEIVSPGADIVGFEHPASTDADRKAIAKATAIFREAGALIVLPAAAGCKVVSAKVEAPGGAGHDGHGHSHGHGHDRDKKHSKGHDDKHGAHHGEHHSEFEGHYRYQCADAKKLTHIDIKLFDQFPRAREIEVQAITSSGQVARELTPGSARLKL